MNYKSGIVLVALLGLTGCTSLGDSDDPPDARAVGELRTQGVTYAISSGSFPALSLEPICSTSAEYIHDLQGFRFYFSPDMNLSTQAELVEFFDDGDLRTPYEFTFSVAEGESFSQIDPYLDSVIDYQSALAQPEDGNVYFGIATSHTAPQSFLTFGEFFMRSQNSSFPARATHVEFWLNDGVEPEKQLVNRVALEDLYGWRTYIQPHLQTDLNGNVQCVVSES